MGLAPFAAVAGAIEEARLTAVAPQWRAEQAAGSPGSSMQHAADRSSGSAPGSSVDNPYVV